MSGCTQYSQQWNTFSGLRSGSNTGKSRTFLRINVVKEHDVTLLHLITFRGVELNMCSTVYKRLKSRSGCPVNSFQCNWIDQNPFFHITYLASFRQFLVKSFLVSLSDLVVSTSTGLAVVWIISTCWLNYSHASKLDSEWHYHIGHLFLVFIHFNFGMTTMKLISLTFKNKFFV